MKKIILALFCLLILIPTPAFANDKDSCQNPYTEELDEKVQEFKKKDANILEAYAMGFAENIINFFNLNTLDQLLFGNPYCIWFEDEDSSISEGLEYGLYPSELKEKVVDPAFSIFSSVYFLVLALAMMILGLRKASSFIGVNNISFGENLLYYVATSILMVVYFFGADVFFLLNWSIASGVKDILTAQGVSTSFNFLMTDSILKAKTLDFTDILFLYAEWIILFFLNLVYILRLFIITILLIMGGFAILALLFEKTRRIFSLWFMAFIGNVFLQSIHAIYLGAILLFFSIDGLSVFFKFLLLLFFLPMSSMMMTWIGLADGLMAVRTGQDLTNKAATAFTLAKRGSKMLGAKKGMPAVDTIGKTRISALATNMNGLNVVKNVAGMTSAGLGAAAGLIVSPGGAVLGGMAGSTFAKGAIQGASNTFAGIKGMKETLEKTKAEGFNMNHLSDRRQYYGNMGESIGTFVGKGEFGRNIGHALSGVSRQRILNSTEIGGLGGLTINDVVTRYPGAAIQFQQTNEGSGFYLNENGDMKLISPLGHADSSLDDGQTRVVDYEARPSDYVPNANGTYTPNLNTNSDSPLSRISEAYIKDTNGTQYQDYNSDASKLNPSDYYRSGMPGVDTRSISDYIADKMPFAQNIQNNDWQGR